MTEVVLALIERSGRWFLQRRDLLGMVLPGLWEFPGGKVERGESITDALFREVQEEVAVSISAFRAMAPLEGEPRLHPFQVRVLGQPTTALAWGWFTPDEIRRLPIPPRNLAIIERILSS